MKFLFPKDGESFGESCGNCGSSENDNVTLGLVLLAIVVMIIIVVVMLK